MICARIPLTKAPTGQRRCVVAQSAVDRRAVFAGLVAGVTALTSGTAGANVATPVDLFDDRKRTAPSTGWDIIDEARDGDLPINVRDGISQYRKDLVATKARFTESAKRIRTDVRNYIDKRYWTDAVNELHNQLGNIRADMRTITASMPNKSDRKEGASKARNLIVAMEDLDYALQRQDTGKTATLYAKVNDELTSFTKFAMG